MVNLTIDGLPVQVPEETSVLEAAKTVNIDIPHLCYLKDLNEIGACRVCCVEVKGEQRMVTACNTEVREGMEVFTRTPRVRSTRRTNVELILSQHDIRCAACSRSGSCQLQRLANDMDVLNVHYEAQLLPQAKAAWTNTFPLYHDLNRCIKCMRCIQVCSKVQSVNIWDVTGTGSRTRVDVSGNRVIKESDCTLCGQCITHCPVGGLRERDDILKVLDALADPDKITVVQVAPAVRTAWGEYFGLTPEESTMERMASCLRRMGFDYVFDTNFAADLTIMEEASEFLRRLRTGSLVRWPMFTSCCPAWVRFLKGQYPKLTGQLSTAKSPQQMFGSVTKSWFAQKLNIPAEKICCVSLMPCLAKKAECALPTMATPAGPDVDYVLTTRELVRMFRSDHIDPRLEKDEPLDDPLGIHSGAGAIFGTTGGVMEAALRTAVYQVTGENPDPDAFQAVRTGPGLREAVYEIAGTPVRCAVVSGLGNARELLDRLIAGKVRYDFVEVMACPGGCVGGGGQPISIDDEEKFGERGEKLYDLDRKNPLRFSHENPTVQALYSEYLGAPLSELAEELLHTDHRAWQMPGKNTRTR